MIILSDLLPFPFPLSHLRTYFRQYNHLMDKIEDIEEKIFIFDILSLVIYSLCLIMKAQTLQVNGMYNWWAHRKLNVGSVPFKWYKIATKKCIYWWRKNATYPTNTKLMFVHNPCIMHVRVRPLYFIKSFHIEYSRYTNCGGNNVYSWLAGCHFLYINSCINKQ